jgi:hypothetical protein
MNLKMCQFENEKCRMNFLNDFPDSKALLSMFPEEEMLKVNAHIHTPYSFSAFTDISQAFEMARKENIAVLGINDFFVTDGYEAFYNESVKSGIFPLFNIEFIGLLKKEQQEGIRVNDPGNPGRVYFCGKGLRYPFTMDDSLNKKLARVVNESQHQVRAMIDKTNHWFAELNLNIRLDYSDIRTCYAKNLVRERHIAKAIRIAVYDQAPDVDTRIALFTTIFGGKAPDSAHDNLAGIENEIRSNLLKAGGKAFVPEDEAAFLSLDEIIEIILNAGGIPCYPVLLDDKKGNYTEYEKDPEELWNNLQAKNVRCVELIPGRNDAGHIDRFVRFFHDKGFIILLGTEHNTPEMIPLTCQTRGNHALSDTLAQISWEGACVVAAHQYLVDNNLPGFTSNSEVTGYLNKDNLVKLGNAIIHYFGKHFNTSDHGKATGRPH